MYAGNQPGQVGDLEHTACPNCGIRLIAREGYRVLGYSLTEKGRCGRCDALIPGRWDATQSEQIATRPFLPDSRRLRMLP